MVRVVGRWFAKDSYCINFTPKYRFAKVIKRVGSPFYDRYNYQCQTVEIETYGFKKVGYSTIPYVSDTTYYMPTKKVGHEMAVFRVSPKGNIRLSTTSSFDDLELWDGKKPIAVVEHYGRD